MVKDHNVDIADLSTSKPPLDMPDLAGMSTSDTQTTASGETINPTDCFNTPHDQLGKINKGGEGEDNEPEISEISGREELPGGKVSMSTQVLLYSSTRRCCIYL